MNTSSLLIKPRSVNPLVQQRASKGIYYTNWITHHSYLEPWNNPDPLARMPVWWRVPPDAAPLAMQAVYREARFTTSIQAEFHRFSITTASVRAEIREALGNG